MFGVSVMRPVYIFCVFMISPRKRSTRVQSGKGQSKPIPDFVDEEYQLASSDEEVEDESTIEEEEELAGAVDHDLEVNALMEEGMYV